MTKQLPAERPLPDKQQILERILTAETPPAHRHRSWLIPAAAAAAITVVTGSILISTQPDQTVPGPAASRPAPTASSTPPKAPAGPPDIRINLRRLTPAERTAIAARCTDRPTNGRNPTQLGHGFKVRSRLPNREVDTVAYLSTDGLRYACDGRGEAYNATVVGGDEGQAKSRKLTITKPDATHPAAPADGGTYTLHVELDRKPDLLLREAWYQVDDRVASIRQRWIVAGKPGPWFVAEPADGLVFLRSWDDRSALALGQVVRLETQVVGTNGDLLDAPADPKGGGGLTPSPGTTRVDQGKVVPHDSGIQGLGTVTF